MVKKFMDYLSISLIVFLFLPLCNNNIPGISYLIPLWIITFCFFHFKNLKDKSIIRILCLGFYFVTMYFFVWDTTSEKMEEIWFHGMFFKDFQSLFLAITIYLHYKNDKDGLVRLCKIAILCILITIVLTIFVSFCYPEFSRNILMAEYMEDSFSEAEIKELLFFKKFGSGTRADGFGFMIICILSCFIFKQRRHFQVNKWVAIVFIIISVFALVQMAFAALLIYTLFFSALSLVDARQRKVVIAISVLLLLIYIVIPVESWAGLFYYLSDYLGEDSSLGVRFHDVADYFVYGEMAENNGVTSRMDVRYISAFYAFLSSPIFGVQCLHNTSYGLYNEFHLFLMNKLVVTGLVGFILWLNVFLGFYHDYKVKIFKSFHFIFILIFCAILSYGLLKVIIVRQAWLLLFVILPGINHYIEEKMSNVKNPYKFN